MSKLFKSSNETWCIIPARGGSKRLPDKNIVPFLGKPIIEYPIREALNSGIFDRVIVSTDSSEIEAVSRKAGALVYLRKQTTDDHIPLATSIRETLLNSYGDLPFLFAVLPTTAVMVDIHRIRDTYIQVTDDPKVNGLMYVTALDIIPEYAMSFFPDPYIIKRHPDLANYNSQSFSKAYYPANSISWFKTNPYLEKHPDLPHNIIGKEISDRFVQDVHSTADLETLKRKYSLWEAGKRR